MNPRSSFKRRHGGHGGSLEPDIHSWAFLANDKSADFLNGDVMKQQLANLRNLKTHLECTNWMLDKTCGNALGSNFNFKS